MLKILYLWDFAGTLFHEDWNKEKTGFKSCWEWIEDKLGKPRAQITDREYEEMHKTLYLEGWHFNLAIQPGVQEVLSWAKNNEGFTTGVPEQISWRAEYLTPRMGFDIRDYIKKVHSTFDYGETNKKTQEMLIDILEKKYGQGYKVVVYTDDKISNCQFFREAADALKDKFPDFSYRIYHILNNNQELQVKKNYFEIGNLLDLLKQEKSL